MVGYIEKPINFMSNMTALAAKDASFTSAPNSQGPPLTFDNGVVQEFLATLRLNTIFHPSLGTSTSPPVAFHVENSTVANGKTHHHHDGSRLTDLAALRADITQTFATFSTFLDTLAPLPTKTIPVQPTMAMTSITTDDDDVPCSIGLRQPMADANNALSQHHTRHQPVDLLALQREIQQFTDDMTAFFDSLFTSTGTIQRSNNRNDSNR